MSERRPWRWAAVLVPVLALAAGGWWMGRSAPQDLACAIDMSARVVSPGSAPCERRLHGRLLLRLHPRAGHHLAVARLLADPDGGEAAWAEPFVFTLEADGSIHTPQLSRALDAGQRSLVLELLELLTVHRDAEASYVRRQEGALGGRLVAYRRSGGNGLERRTDRFLPEPGSLRPVVTVRHSRFRCQMEEVWWAELEGEETLELTVPDTGWRQQATLRLQARRIPADGANLPQEAPEVVVAALQSRPPPAPPPPSASTPSAAAALEALRSGVDPSRRRALLAAWQAEPEAVRALPVLLPDLDDATQREVVKLLGVAGQGPAQEALCDVCRRQDLPDGLRFRAVQACASLEEPPIEALVEILLAPTTADDDETAGAAILAVGAIAGNISPRHPEVAQRLVGRLVQELAVAGSTARRRLLILALGNSRDEGTVPTLTAALEADEATMRRAALQALGTLRSPAAIPPLLARLPQEDDAGRAVALEALAGLPLTEGQLRPLIDLLHADVAEEVRLQAIRALAAQRLRHPSAVRSALEQALHGETSPSIRRRLLEAWGPPVEVRRP